MDKSRYTDVGLFENKQEAMSRRRQKYTLYSCYTEKEKVRLWIKRPSKKSQTVSI